FGESGRQKSDIYPSFCLLSNPRALNFDQPVDKSRTFLTVFIYFSLCAPKRLFQAALDFH
ncbi:hypothetical protein, partial [Ligilactobacillus ruminis]|uniref:hypothetical protein n=1 Tax=Ligilactobacillus ruminis TaxID=1623 RepID=UPI001CDAB6BE